MGQFTSHQTNNTGQSEYISNTDLEILLNELNKPEPLLPAITLQIQKLATTKPFLSDDPAVFTHTDQHYYDDGTPARNSSPLLATILSTSCLNSAEQIKLVRLYINTSSKVTLFDLFISCMNAESPGPSLLILNTYLANKCNQNNCSFLSRTISGQSILDIAMRRFQAFLNALNHLSLNLDSINLTLITDQRRLLINLIRNGVPITNLTSQLLIYLLVDSNEFQLVPIHLHDELNKSLKQLLINLATDSDSRALNIYRNHTGLDKTQFHNYTKSLLYNQFQRCCFDAINTENKLLINSLVDLRQPINLQELARMSLKKSAKVYKDSIGWLKEYLAEEPLDSITDSPRPETNLIYINRLVFFYAKQLKD